MLPQSQLRHALGVGFFEFARCFSEMTELVAVCEPELGVLARRARVRPTGDLQWLLFLVLSSSVGLASC